VDISSVLIQVGASGTFAGVATYFLKRYISINDNDIKTFRHDLNRFSEKIFIHTKELAEHKVEVVKAISDSRDSFRKIEERILDKTSQVMIDLKETKVLLSKVMDDQKEKKQEDKEINGKIIWILNKIPLIESQYQEIINTLHRNGRR
jgi:hypothetical protein